MKHLRLCKTAATYKNELINRCPSAPDEMLAKLRKYQLADVQLIIKGQDTDGLLAKHLKWETQLIKKFEKEFSKK
jgi:hypothetical protein